MAGLIGATVLLLVCSWLSSGTLAPYAATLRPTLLAVLGPCEYLYNCDHPHFAATFKFLEGAPRSSWEFSVVIRRILYPLLAFPFMKVLGFETGGFVANLVITVAAFVVFVVFVRRQIGDRAAISTMWLLATYPGIAYWIGLPYSYAWIVPGSLLAAILLSRLSTASRQSDVLGIGFLLGIIFCGYDLLPFFLPAGWLLLARRKQYRLIPSLTAGVLAPVLLVLLVLDKAFGVPAMNSNTETYFKVFESFLSPDDFGAWWKLLLHVPSVFIETFLFSNFTFIPLLFVAFALASFVLRGRIRMQSPELEIAVSVLLVFLINNLAPPYPGWQLRGSWIARLYQPLFVSLVLFIAREVQAWSSWGQGRGARAGWLALALVIAASAANATIVFGPALGFAHASLADDRFYGHSEPKWLKANLDQYGRRPLGFCRRR